MIVRQAKQEVFFVISRNETPLGWAQLNRILYIYYLIPPLSGSRALLELAKQWKKTIFKQLHTTNNLEEILWL